MFRHPDAAGLPDFSWYMIPKPEKCTKWTHNVPNVHKISQMSVKYYKMAIKYINIFQSKALQNLPKFGFLVWKQTIWQPWDAATKRGRRNVSYLTAFLGTIRQSFTCVVSYLTTFLGTIRQSLTFVVSEWPNQLNVTKNCQIKIRLNFTSI
jgi:hypothetical protein